MCSTTGVLVSFLVMAGLDPATHILASHCRAQRDREDARNKSGHDDYDCSFARRGEGRARR